MSTSERTDIEVADNIRLLTKQLNEEIALAVKRELVVYVNVKQPQGGEDPKPLRLITHIFSEVS